MFLYSKRCFKFVGFALTNVTSFSILEGRSNHLLLDYNNTSVASTILLDVAIVKASDIVSTYMTFVTKLFGLRNILSALEKYG